MLFLRQHKFALIFLLLLAFCSIMVVRQLMHRYEAKNTRHTEMRETMILLHTGGYSNEATRLYWRLYRELETLPNKQLVEDWQRTVTLVDPSANQPSNSVWRYYWTVRKEMERRSEDIILRARKLADEEE